MAWAGKARAAGLGWFRVCPWVCGGVRCREKRHLWGEGWRATGLQVFTLPNFRPLVPGLQPKCEVIAPGSKSSAAP